MVHRRPSSSFFRSPTNVSFVLVAGAIASCATGVHNGGSFMGGGGDDASFSSGGSSGSSSFGASSGVTIVPCSGPCTDFPSSPILDSNVTSQQQQLFKSSGSNSGGPCLVEPAAGALFPNNWVRPRFQVQPVGSQNLFEIRVHAAAEKNDLLVYTSSTTWTMPKDMWAGLKAHVVDTPITVTVRGLDSSSNGSPATGSSGTFSIAPVNADGAMVYWATSAFDNNAQNTQLRGFHVGEESTVSALQTSQVQQKIRATWGPTMNDLKDQITTVQCIGCHTSTPDGNAVAFTAQWPWPNALAAITAESDAAAVTGSVPSFLTMAAQSNLSPNTMGLYESPQTPMSTGATCPSGSSMCVANVMLGVQTFSKAHYAPGDRIVVTTEGSAWYRANPMDVGAATGVVAELMWFDLETSSMASGTGFGKITRTGEANGISAVAPNWSHDGSKIVYVATDTGAEDGRMGGQGSADLEIVPYGNKGGGQIQKVSGASDSSYNEYYPAFSADDSLIAFNRVASGQSMYIQPAAEVYVVPAGGGTATRLAANDPVACSGAKSPGVQNTWPKWAPAAPMANGKTYHWLIFSSTRAGGNKAQLYITAVVQNGNSLQTYPAIYVWNQDATINNLIPAWDVFQIPSVPIQ